MRKADECMCRHERYDSVADRVQSVHPMGQPISHSTNGGLRTIGSLPALGVVGSWGPEPVDHAAASLGRSLPPLVWPLSGPLQSLA